MLLMLLCGYGGINMAYTDKQAKAKAKQIFERFGQLIHDACVGTGVSESFLAGFTGVEAGIDRQGNIKPNATRFEKGVYQDLISLRDNGYCFVGGDRHTTYSGVRQSQIKDADDAAIRALATSYSFSQIMGWHCINNLKCSIAELRDENKHFHYTVQLLKIVGGTYMKHGDLTAVLHIWNTGNANGKTYHGDYVENALKVKRFYDEMIAASPLFTASISAATPAAKPTDEQPSDGDSAQDALNDTPSVKQPPTSDSVVVPKETEPPGFFRSLWKEILGLFGSIGGADRVTDYATQAQTFGLPAEFWVKVFYAIAIIAAVWFGYKVWKYVWCQIAKRRRTDNLIEANKTPTNQVIVAKQEDLAALEAAGWHVVQR